MTFLLGLLRVIQLVRMISMPSRVNSNSKLEGKAKAGTLEKMDTG